MWAVRAGFSLPARTRNKRAEATQPRLAVGPPFPPRGIYGENNDQVGRSCCGCLSRRNVGAGHVDPAASSGERHDHASPGGMWRGYAHGQRRLHYYIRTPSCSARSGHRSLKNLSSPIVRGHRRAAKFSGLARRRDADRHASLIPARLFARNYGERLPSPTPVTRI